MSVAGRPDGGEAVQDSRAAAAEAVCSRMEGLQLTPLQQLLKLCAQQVRPTLCWWCVLHALDQAGCRLEHLRRQCDDDDD